MSSPSSATSSALPTSAGVADGKCAGHCGGVDADRAVLGLYGLAPEEFTAARNALVKAAKDAGEHPVGDSVRALRKPTLAAWLANQLVRTEPDQVNDLTELGDQPREAHLSADGPRLRELTPRRHRLVQALVRTAEVQATASGRTVSSAMRYWQTGSKFIGWSGARGQISTSRPAPPPPGAR